MVSRLVILFLLIFSIGCTNKHSIKVGIQPLGNFSDPILDTLATAITATYGVTTFALNHKKIPSQTFINVKTPRYRGDQIIKILKDQKPDSLNYIIGVLEKDISTTKEDMWGNVKKPESKYSDWGIFGLGYMPGSSCVVSTFRLNANKSLAVERIKKVAIHELGHNFGLDHCDSKYCVMRDAVESIKTIDKVSLQLCGRCKSKMKYLPLF